MKNIVRIDRVPTNELAYTFVDGELILEFTQDGRYSITKFMEDKERKAMKMRDRKY
jgi:hypothetical protein